MTESENDFVSKISSPSTNAILSGDNNLERTDIGISIYFFYKSNRILTKQIKK